MGRNIYYRLQSLYLISCLTQIYFINKAKHTDNLKNIFSILFYTNMNNFPLLLNIYNVNFSAIYSYFEAMASESLKFKQSAEYNYED